jgi:outer membrane lipoprotein-sorting protein
MLRVIRRGALLALSALALAACSAGQLNAEQIVERMEQAQQQTNDLHAVVAVDFVTNERSGTMLVENWSKAVGAPDAAGERVLMQRAEVREAEQPRLVGLTFVSNGETFWLYTPAERTVLTGTRAELEQLRSNSGIGGASGPFGAIEGMQSLLQPALDATNVEMLPDEQLGDQAAWKLKLTPKSEGEGPRLDGLASATLWVDPQRALPLKMQLDASDAGEGTLEARTLETNTGLADSLFTFEIPQGARVLQASEIQRSIQPQRLGLDDARAQVDFPLLAPATLPEGTSLVEVQLFQQGGSPAVIQNYSGPVAFSLAQGRNDIARDREPPAGSQVSEVTVRGQPATLITNTSGSQGGSLLRWQENGVTIFIAGTLSGEQALAVAESLQ